ncbi:hypothetical protein H5410_047625 [Solanum commersonii]|uniref:Uncharacterized protein n=1 Tax=Solanum commersonii TaxID=4109 RepID=A0A9J5XHV4_SOLCO|nr:hypothetical protein H5410_047625 [Solanum commersonii]
MKERDEWVVIWRSHMMEIKADRNDGSLVLVKHGAEAITNHNMLVSPLMLFHIEDLSNVESFHVNFVVGRPLFTKKYRHLTVESKLTREDLSGLVRPGAYSKQYAIDAPMHLTFEYVEGPS